MVEQAYLEGMMNICLGYPMPERRRHKDNLRLHTVFYRKSGGEAMYAERRVSLQRIVILARYAVPTTRASLPAPVFYTAAAINQRLHFSSKAYCDESKKILTKNN
jgi:hypothetical protein